MKNVTIFSALAFLLLIATTALAQSSESLRVFDMEGVQVRLPAGTAVKRENAIDFVTYYFSVGEEKSKRQVLFAYVGSFPWFPEKAPDGITMRKQTINHRSARTLEWKDKDSRLCRETLFCTGRDDNTKFVHFEYFGLTPSDAKMADDIIATVEPVSETPANTSTSGVTGSGLSQTLEPKPLAYFNMGALQISLPTSVSLRRLDAEDFANYYVEMGEGGSKQQILYAYVGYAPSFPGYAPENTQERKHSIHGMAARTLEWKDKDGRSCRETLINSEMADFPPYVQFVYIGLTPADAKIGDDIIATLEPKPKSAKTSK